MSQIERLLQSAKAALHDKNFIVANYILKQVVDIDSDDIDALIYYSFSLFMLSDTKLARKYWLEAFHKMNISSPYKPTNPVTKRCSELIKTIPYIDALIFNQCLNTTNSTYEWVALLTYLHPLNTSGYILSCVESKSFTDTKNGTHVVVYEDNEDDRWIYQFLGSARNLLNLGLGQEYPQEVIDYIDQWVYVNLKHPTSIKDFTPTYSSTNYIETIFLVRAEHQKDLNNLRNIGFDYPKWEEISLNNQPYPECLQDFYLEYAGLETRKEWGHDSEWIRIIKDQRKYRKSKSYY